MTNTTETQDGSMADPGRIPKVTPEDVLAEFTEQEDRAEPMTAPELAERLECSRRTALNKLHTLAEEDAVASKKVGGRSRVWWVPLTDAERAATDGRESGVREPSPHAEGSPGHAPEDAQTSEDAVEELALPGSGANLEGRREAVRAIYDYLKEHGSGRRSDFKDLVEAEETGYSSFNSFYTNCLDNGAVLAELPGVRSPGEGGHQYTFAGE